MHAHMLLLAAALAQAPAKIDISAYRQNLKVLTDGGKRFIVFEATKPLSGPAFYGDGKAFSELHIRGGGAVAKESFDLSFWEPRVVPGITGHASLTMKEGGKKFTVACGKKELELTLLADEPAKAILDQASFTAFSFTRLPEKLLRDDRGNYYFVDRLRTEEPMDRRDFRLFIGARGKMKLQPLKDIVDDTEGMIFSTRDGQLRLVASKSDSDAKRLLKWVAGKSEVLLVDVPLDDPRNVRMVYTDLGPYDGLRLGTPCDDLF